MNTEIKMKQAAHFAEYEKSTLCCNPDHIKTEDFSVFYGDFEAVKKVTCGFPKGLVTAMIGPSGCGKSTMLRAINRMNDLIPRCHAKGKMVFADEDIYRRDIDVVSLRMRVGMVFQKPNVFPKSIYDNIAYGPRLQGIRNRTELDELVENSLRQAAIWDEVKDRLASNALGMSGGQQQRLCLARALDGRADLRARPKSYGKNRGSHCPVTRGLHAHHRDAQYATGRPCFRFDRLHV